MTAMSEFNEIWTLAELDEAICRIEDEDTGWGIGRHLDSPECDIFFDLVDPGTVKIVWPSGRTPGVAEYVQLGVAMPEHRGRVRVDWSRGPRGVWEVFRFVS